mmetsp:Transcript_1167/g.3678  ORF Transcript_1167/g.3678 Transcript_1167/m.3678 type:complete len:157 (-) Transcript_1167:468-938(-)
MWDSPSATVVSVPSVQIKNKMPRAVLEVVCPAHLDLARQCVLPRRRAGWLRVLDVVRDARSDSPLSCRRRFGAQFVEVKEHPSADLLGVLARLPAFAALAIWSCGRAQRVASPLAVGGRHSSAWSLYCAPISTTTAAQLLSSPSDRPVETSKRASM